MRKLRQRNCPLPCRHLESPLLSSPCLLGASREVQSRCSTQIQRKKYMIYSIGELLTKREVSFVFTSLEKRYRSETWFWSLQRDWIPVRPSVLWATVFKEQGLAGDNSHDPFQPSNGINMASFQLSDKLNYRVKIKLMFSISAFY